MIDQIEYLVKRFGADYVAIGTDLAYIPRQAEAEYRKMGRRPKARTRYEAFWPDGAFEDVVHLSAGPWTAHYRSLLLTLAARLAAPSGGADDPCGDASQAWVADGIARR